MFDAGGPSTLLRVADRVERTCPSCGHTESTIFERCSACGASFFAPPPSSRRRAAQVVVVAAVLLAVAVGAFAALRAAGDRADREKAETARAVAARKVELRRLQAPKRGGEPSLTDPAAAAPERRRSVRARLVEATEAAITTDARARIASGELQGEVVRTDCGPIEKRPDAVGDDTRLEIAVGRFDCIAVSRPVIDGDGTRVADFGFAFVAAVDFARGRFVWCRNNPPQSERGESVYVRLDRACLAAKGKALGTGYVDDR